VAAVRPVRQPGQRRGQLDLQPPAGRKAFTDSLIRQFDTTYARSGSFWTAAVEPKPVRPILELRHLRAARCRLNRPHVDPRHRQWLPNKSAACENRLSQFFVQWFDTAYPSGGCPA